jgi:hypothetical protein
MSLFSLTRLAEGEPAPGVGFNLRDAGTGDVPDLLGQATQTLNGGLCVAPCDGRPEEERLALDQQHVGVVRVLGFGLLQ